MIIKYYKTYSKYINKYQYFIIKKNNNKNINNKITGSSNAPIPNAPISNALTQHALSIPPTHDNNNNDNIDESESESESESDSAVLDGKITKMKNNIAEKKLNNKK
eukprot:260115_1